MVSQLGIRLHPFKKTLQAAEIVPRQQDQLQQPGEVMMDRPGPPVPYPLAPNIVEIVYGVYHRLILSETMVDDCHQ